MPNAISPPGAAPHDARAGRMRRLRYGGNAVVAALAFAGLVVVANLAAATRYARWDWTGSHLYALSDKTTKILKGLTTDVDATVLIQPGREPYDDVHALLQSYGALTSRLKIEFLDPDRQPARVDQLLKKFGIDARGDTTAVVFSSGDRHKHVALMDLVEYDYANAAMGGEPRIKSFKGEMAFTSAIMSVSESRQRGICFLKGHDEVSQDDPGPRGLSRLVEALERENFKIETTDTLGRGPLPAGCDILVIAGPTRTFTPPEASALASYIDSGGHLLALLDPPFSREGILTPLGIEKVFLDRGIAIGDDIVLDPGQRLQFGSAETFAANDFPSHVITKGLEGSFIVVGLARSVAPIQPPPQGWTLAPLARTTGAGWAERNLAHLQEGVRKDPEDTAGPVVFAVTAEKKLEGNANARIVAIGDSDLAQNQVVGLSANLDFLINAVAWLVSSEQQIGISPREPEQVRLAMTGRQQWLVGVVTFLGLPGATVLFGILVWMFRRR